MTPKEKYEHLMQVLRNKLKKGQLTKREDGYNEGILCAMSKIREVYKEEE